MRDRFWLAKVSRGAKVGLIPTDDEARNVLRRLGEGECAEFSMLLPRSVPWHRMYFGLCRTIGDNQDPPRDESSIDYELRILAGHYDIMYVGRAKLPWWFNAMLAWMRLGGDTGGWFAARLERWFGRYEVRVPKRIAFDKMSPEEWSEYWKRAEQAIAVRFGEEYIAELGRAA